MASSIITCGLSNLPIEPAEKAYFVLLLETSSCESLKSGLPAELIPCCFPVLIKRDNNKEISILSPHVERLDAFVRGLDLQCIQDHSPNKQSVPPTTFKELIASITEGAVTCIGKRMSYLYVRQDILDCLADYVGDEDYEDGKSFREKLAQIVSESWCGLNVNPTNNLQKHAVGLEQVRFPFIRFFIDNVGGTESLTKELAETLLLGTIFARLRGDFGHSSDCLQLHKILHKKVLEVIVRKEECL